MFLFMITIVEKLSMSIPTFSERIHCAHTGFFLILLFLCVEIVLRFTRNFAKQSLSNGQLLGFLHYTWNY